MNWAFEEGGVSADVFVQTTKSYKLKKEQKMQKKSMNWASEEVSQQMCSYKLVPRDQSHLLLHKNVRFFVLKSQS